MRTFSGFAAGQVPRASLPDQFFAELLPLIDDLVELKVTLACLRLFDQKPGLVQWTTAAELTVDAALVDVKADVAAGLAKAIERGSLLSATDRSGQAYLFANTEVGRAAAAAIERGERIEAIPAIANRPNIYVLYEQVVGSLTPIIAEQLRDAEQEFPAQWIEDAFAEAARQNIRSWAYIAKILNNRARKGKSNETRGPDFTADRQRYLERKKRK